MKFKETKIGEIATFINGYPFKPTDRTTEGYKIIRIQNLTNPLNSFNLTNKKIPEKYIIRKGDILISWSATIDIFEWNDENAYLNQHIFKVSFDESRINKVYFKYALKKTLKELNKFAHGAVMKHLVKKDFENHLIPLPELSEQYKIATILSKAESIVEQKMNSILLMENLIDSLFLEKFGDLSKKGTEFPVVPLSEITTHIKDGPHTSPLYSDKGIPIFSARNIKPNKLVLDQVKNVSKKTYTEITKYFKPKKNDVLLTKGGTTGYAKRVDWDFDFCVWVHIAVLRLKPEINPTYVEKALNSQHSYYQSQKYTQGIANKDLGLLKIANIKIILPPFELQNQFSTVVSKIEDTIKFEEQALNETKALFESLTEACFSGTLSDQVRKKIDKLLFASALSPKDKNSEWTREQLGDHLESVIENKPLIKEIEQQLDYFLKEKFSKSTFSFEQIFKALKKELETSEKMALYELLLIHISKGIETNLIEQKFVPTKDKEKIVLNLIA